VLNKIKPPSNGFGCCDYCEMGEPCPCHDVCMTPEGYARLLEKIELADRMRFGRAIAAQFEANN